MAANNGKHSQLILVLVSYVSFIALGMPSGLLSVAWPSMRTTFRLPIDAVGLLMGAVMAGSLVSAFVSGPLAARIGIGRLLVLNTAVAVLGLLGYALVPTWWMIIACGLLVGISAGMVDSVLNVVFAALGSSRLMGWLHAFYGAGAMLGPLVMTGILEAGHSWRWGYAGAGLLQAALLACFALTSRWWDTPDSLQVQDGDQPAMASVGRTLRLPALWLSLALFLLAAGVESSAGQWPYSMFTEARAVAPVTAGLWTSVYWAALTVGRVLTGLVGDRFSITATLRGSLVAVTIGALLVWWRGSDLASFLGLAMMGIALAPIYPLLQLITPRRLGAEHAANAIGFQTAVGYLGVGILPGLAGVLAKGISLEIIGPFLLVGALAMSIAHETVVRREPRGAGSPAS